MYDVCHPSVLHTPCGIRVSYGGKLKNIIQDRGFLKFQYYKIGELGCKDDVKITTAFYVYVELCEERRFWDVNYKYHEDLDLIYLEAKICKNGETEIYIPWATNNNITLRNIENIQEHLQCKRFTLVLKGGESSSVFYKVTEGLEKPLTPQMAKESKSKSDKKSELERDIRNNSRNLYELAKTVDNR